MSENFTDGKETPGPQCVLTNTHLQKTAMQKLPRRVALEYRILQNELVHTFAIEN